MQKQAIALSLHAAQAQQQYVNNIKMLLFYISLIASTVYLFLPVKF